MSKKYKPKNQNSKTALVPYEDRAMQMNRKALEKEFDFAAKKISEAKKECDNLAKVNIKSANKCREAGIALITLCGGHEHITMDFWIKHDCEKRLGIGYETAKWFIHIAKKYPDEITTLQEAAPIYLQCFFACEMLEMPHREESQRALNISFLQKALASITTVRATFEKAWREVPIEKMKPSQLSEFLKDTQWLEDARDKAQRLIGDSMRS